MDFRVSICIPTYSMHRGIEYLNYSLNIIAQQSYKWIEVVVSDHSVDTAVEQLCAQYEQALDIVYVKHTSDRGNSSSNLNNSVRNATGDIIKVLFQDDFLISEFSVESHVQSLVTSDARWSITACAHYEEEKGLVDPHYPFFNHDILFTNTLSSPSTLLIYKDSYLEFDTNLLWYMDTDVYKRLYDAYGPPSICNTVNVVNRRHPYQITNTLVDESVIQAEKRYLHDKYALK